MYRIFYPSEEILNSSEDERTTATTSSNNLIRIAKHMEETEIYLSASKSYVDASKTILRNLKRHICLFEADISSAAECITESEIRLQRMHVELQSLFQNAFYQDSGHNNRYNGNERNLPSNQATSCSPGHQKYTESNNSLHGRRCSISRKMPDQQNTFFTSYSNPFGRVNLASGKVIDLTDSNSKVIGFRNQKRMASNEQTPGACSHSFAKRKVGDSGQTKTASETSKINNDYFPHTEFLKRSFNNISLSIPPDFLMNTNEASCSKHQVRGKCSSTANLQESEIYDEGNFESNSCIQMTGDNNPSELAPMLERAKARILSRFSEFLKSETANLNKRCSGRLIGPQTDEMNAMFSSKFGSFSQGKKSENAQEDNRKTNSSVIFEFDNKADSIKPSCSSKDFTWKQEKEYRGVCKNAVESGEIFAKRNISESKDRIQICPLSLKKSVRSRKDNRTIISSMSDDEIHPGKISSLRASGANSLAMPPKVLKMVDSKNEEKPTRESENNEKLIEIPKGMNENESFSRSASHASLIKETNPTLPWKNKIPIKTSTTNQKEASCKLPKSGSPFSRKNSISLICDSMQSCPLTEKGRTDICDRGNNCDNVLTHERFPPNVSLEATIELNEGIENNDNNATLPVISGNLSKTKASSELNIDYASSMNRSLPSSSNNRLFTSTNNALRSFHRQKKPYSSNFVEIPEKLSLEFPTEITERENLESRSYACSHTSNAESSRYADCQTEQFNSIGKEAARAAFSDSSSRKSSSTYLSYEELLTLDDNKDMMLLEDELSDTTISTGSVTLDNVSFDTESEYFETSPVPQESEDISDGESASAMSGDSDPSETNESEKFRGVPSRLFAHSSPLTNFSRFSLTGSRSSHPISNSFFSPSPREITRLRAENSLSANQSPTNRQRTFEDPQVTSKTTNCCYTESNPRSITFVLPLTTPAITSTPIHNLSSSSEDST